MGFLVERSIPLKVYDKVILCHLTCSSYAWKAFQLWLIRLFKTSPFMGWWLQLGVQKSLTCFSQIIACSSGKQLLESGEILWVLQVYEESSASNWTGPKPPSFLAVTQTRPLRKPYELSLVLRLLSHMNNTSDSGHWLVGQTKKNVLSTEGKSSQ